MVQQGMTLIELMITLAIIGITLFLGAPAYWEWLQNTQIRTAADTMLVGIKLARAEALKRNPPDPAKPVLFQLMDSFDSSCTPSSTGTNWVVSVDDATGKCDVTDASAFPQIIRLKAKAVGTGNVTVPASQPSIGFNGLGRMQPTTAGDISIAIENSAGGACVAASGKMRCLTILVTAGGQARVCNPSVSDSADTRKC
jgi:type IV fimbrial biogenesis protein FimT